MTTAPKRVTRKFVRKLLQASARRAKVEISTYEAEELELLFTYVADLRKDVLQEFLASHDLLKTGSKAEVISRLQDAIEQRVLTYDALIALLDRVEPWSKQHVFLFGSPTDMVLDNWKDAAWVETHLKSNRVHKYLKAVVPLLLPESLRLSRIECDKTRLRVVSVERREGFEHIEEFDKEGLTKDGDEVTYKAFVRQVTRGLICFEWDLQANHAFLQISQLPSHESYDDAMTRFASLVSGWLPLANFPVLPVRGAILQFHKLDQLGQGSVRSHRVELAALDGRRISGSSASAQQSLKGNPAIDQAMSSVRDNGGVGHLGNFYLLPEAQNASNPIATDSDAHIMLLGNRDRLNFMTPQNESVVRYVLQRVREAC